MDVERALLWRGGGATWADLRDRFPRTQVDRALRDGRVIRARRGLYVASSAAPTLAAAASVRGVLSHLSAAQHLAVPLLRRPDAVHVTVPRGRHTRAPAGVVLHRVDLGAHDVRDDCTAPARTVLDCATSLPFAEALAVADGVLREGLLSAQELVAVAEASRGAGRARRLRVARAAHAGAANPFESGLRAAVLDAGLSGFEPQYRVPGTPYVVDLADPALRVALEADSFAHHGSRQALREDCRRYDELVVLGWAVLRFAWEHVMFEPGWVGRVVLDCCRRRG
ncbi:MAG: DUF559 domain-containing protein [Actinobacteria bacterium]|nr:DUF559 domain-containing protein [Actinomycetota bacterium]